MAAIADSPCVQFFQHPEEVLTEAVKQQHLQNMLTDTVHSLYSQSHSLSQETHYNKLPQKQRGKCLTAHPVQGLDKGPVVSRLKWTPAGRDTGIPQSSVVNLQSAALNLLRAATPSHPASWACSSHHQSWQIRSMQSVWERRAQCASRFTTLMENESW